nr:peptidoglycan-binding domain-containing protein [Ruegeria sp. TM1040]
MPASPSQHPAASGLRSASRSAFSPIGSPLPSALRRHALLWVAAALLAGCMTPAPFERVGRPAPPGAPPGTCWEPVIIPARIETITEQVMVSPAEAGTDGNAGKPAVFATETRQVITRPREETYFQTPCPEELTPEYISSLQRALAARGLYVGDITGRLDVDTRAAVRAYQQSLDIQSDTLSLQAARSLGLSAVALDD